MCIALTHSSFVTPDNPNTAENGSANISSPRVPASISTRVKSCPSFTELCILCRLPIP